MRRQLYVGFGIFALFMLFRLTMMHNMLWFFCLCAMLVPVWIYDVVQKKHALLRNFPVLGHIRYII
ncbi:MAG: hypothetical protein B7X00_00915, partial [Legionella sp. 21-45-4]